MNPNNRDIMCQDWTEEMRLTGYLYGWRHFRLPLADLSLPLFYFVLFTLAVDKLIFLSRKGNLWYYYNYVYLSAICFTTE